MKSPLCPTKRRNTGAAARAKGFANNNLVFEVIEQNFSPVRAFGAKAADEGSSGLGAVTPAAAAAAQACAIVGWTQQGPVKEGRAETPGEVAHLTLSGEELRNKEENFTDPPEDPLAEELPHGMSSLRARMAVPGTTAWQFAATIGSLDAKDDWAKEYGAFVARLLDEKTAMEMALSPEARTQTYLALTLQANTFVVLHGLHQWTANPPS
jgi:hypothetical protein